MVTERVASGPDKAGAHQYYQMVWARRAGWKGVREEPAFTSLKRGSAQIWWIWAESGASQSLFLGVGNSWVGFGDRPGDHGEVLRGSRGEAAGTESDSSSVERINSEHGNRPGPAVLPGIRSGGSAGRTDRRSAQDGAEPS